MKKIFVIEDLDCANCAQKMEDGIRRIEGVSACTVSFFTQKLTLEADDDRFDSIVKQVIKLLKRIEPDCRIRVK